MSSYSIIRRVMIHIDYQQLSSVFNNWASQHTHCQRGQWIAVEGSSLKNTVSNYHGSLLIKFFYLLKIYSIVGLCLLSSKLLLNLATKDRMFHVKAIEVHDFIPRCHKVMNEFLL